MEPRWITPKDEKIIKYGEPPVKKLKKPEMPKGILMREDETRAMAEKRIAAGANERPKYIFDREVVAFIVLTVLFVLVIGLCSI